MSSPKHRQRPLTHVVTVPKGKPLRTIEDATQYMLALPKGLASRGSWGIVAGMILDNADPDTITRNIEVALFFDRNLGEPKA